MQEFIKQIQIVKNFLTEEECEYLKNYIESKLDIMKGSKIQGDRRKFISFGKDSFHKDSEVSLDAISEIEPLLRNDIFPRLTDKITSLTNNRKRLMVNNFFLAKQYPGARIDSHVDTDGGQNMQFKFSGIIYLNTMSSGGELHFPDLNYTYSPVAGDLVTFPSKPLEFVHEVVEIHEERYTIPIWLTEYEFFEI
jgi:hypothetical protein